MFGKGKKLFTIFGFEVSLDLSWLFLAFLITWTLAKGYFPNQYKGLSNITYWIMGGVGAIGIFISIVFHEMWHSLVARRHGLPMKGITLFIFGGVAQMEDEPPSAKAEFFMAIAGPISSVILAGLFFLIYLFGGFMKWPQPVTGVLAWLVTINIILAIFNMLPAFPTDGGRVLRSILWKVKGNLRWATRVAARIGNIFSTTLLILGVFFVLTGNIIGGIWWVLISMFLKNASHSAYQRLVVRQSLEGETVRRFMNDNPVIVPPDITIQDLVENYFYKYHFKMFPVVDNGKIAGCVSTQEVKSLPREEWDQKTVADISNKCNAETAVGPETDAMDALNKMNRTQKSRLMVVRDDQLMGIITLKDLLKFLSLKMDLEGEEKAAQMMKR